MKLLLDTHVFLWAVGDSTKLPSRIIGMLESDEHQLLVSAASAWEIAIKSGIGKQMVWHHGPPADLLDDFIGRLGATRLPIHIRHAVEVWRFRDCRNKDPFDRMLATQAVLEGASLVTADAAFGDFAGLTTLWAE